MSSVGVQSKAGSHADLEVALEVAGIPKLPPHDPWAQVGLVAALASVVASVAASTEVAAGSEEASKIAEVMVEVVVVESATKAVVASEAPTDTARRQTHQPARVALVLAAEVATAAAEVDMEALDHRIATVVVGMTRAVAVAHMMIDPADIEAALVVTVTVMPLREASVAATWSL